jgi:acetyl esterase
MGTPELNTPALLSDFHPEAAKLIGAFRENGSVSFQDLPLAESRAAYELSCARNGLPRRELASVESLRVPTPGHDVDGVPVRVYRPQAGGKGQAPCIVFIHGGGWAIGSLDTHDPICRELAYASGATVVAVDYRLSPEHRFPAPLEDCAAVLKHLFANAGQYGIDSARLAVVGDSAGGNMAAVLALMSRDGTLPPLQAQVLLYPVTDLAAESASYARVITGLPLTAASMQWFRNQYLSPSQDAADWRVSPLRAESAAGLAPAFVVTVGHDPLADEGIAYAGRLASAGTAVVHHHLPGYAHGLFTAGGVISAAGPLLGAGAAFMETCWAEARVPVSSDAP